MSMTLARRTSQFLQGQTRRLARNVARGPARIGLAVQRYLSGTYQWEHRIKRELAEWLTDGRLKELDALEGTSILSECRLLAWLAAKAPDGGCIVEIGAWKGRSAAWLVEGAQQHTPPLAVFSIDPHLQGTWEQFRQTVAEQNLERRGLTVHRAFSHDIGAGWNAPISLLWIDGCHDYEVVLQDILDFVPHVVPGGWVVFDDAVGGYFPGVPRAISEQMSPLPEFEHMATLRHLELFRKIST